jgi:hypothetical protein
MGSMSERRASGGLALWPRAEAVSAFGATLRCETCGIFIGPGHVERRPWWSGAEVACGACHRLRERRAVAPPESVEPSRDQAG